MGGRVELKKEYEVVIIGGGPAGLAAGIAASDMGKETLIIEREARLGGILKQCVHDGFGTITFNKKMSGPEYAQYYIKIAKQKKISILTSTYVTQIEKMEIGFNVILVNRDTGLISIQAKTLVLACGCRERTSKQVFINGTRPAGVYTAGSAQYFVNVLGYLPCKKCVILGSGDIGLIMARRLKLEGGDVLGVYEAKSTPSGLTRNIVQCLEDYGIPLYLSHTITRVFGEDRVEGVEISKVDENLQLIPGSMEKVECDGVILSVGLIPENELSEALNVKIDNRTGGPVVDDSFMTSLEGVFSCGNSLHVNDLVDYVTESGVLAGQAAGKYDYEDNPSSKIEVSEEDFLYVVPQRIRNRIMDNKVTIYFRSKRIVENVSVKLFYGDKKIFSKNYSRLNPPEMERIEVNLFKTIRDFGLNQKLSLKMSHQVDLEGKG